MACGTLSQDGLWSTPTKKRDFLFPVHALSKVFRGKFLAALSMVHKTGQLDRDPQGHEDDWARRQSQLYKHDWIVYAKTPMGGPAQVLEYLSRYTHRTAISNERIRAIGKSEVSFKVRADDHGGKLTVRMIGQEFVRRFMLHVPPTGIKRIRHYGVLTSACKAIKLKATRLALDMPTIDARAAKPEGFTMVRRF